MRTLSEILQIVAQAVESLDWNRPPRELYEPIDYTLALGGKRVRPALSLMAADMYDADLQEVIPAALALEVFHNFTLLHDDVMDNAPLRRGRATVHEKWSENTAILSGDVMSIEAYRLLAGVPEKNLKQVLDIFTQMAIEICEGQQMDMNFEQQQSVSKSDYIEMIRLKTAVLLASSLKIGALIAGASTSDCELLYEFGINLGLAFQLQDDYLDVYGNEKTFGKAIGGDILCNKKTYMMLSAIEVAKGEDALLLNKWIESKPSTEKITAITQLYTQLHIDEICRERIDFYHKKAVENLENLSVSVEKLQPLKKLMVKLMHREE